MVFCDPKLQKYTYVQGVRICHPLDEIPTSFNYFLNRQLHAGYDETIWVIFSGLYFLSLSVTVTDKGKMTREK